MGLPPFRTGGLNRYCFDLMEQQAKDGHHVSLLYPGEFTLTGKTKIRREQNTKFDVFRVVNPLPLALTNGISDPRRYMQKCSEEIYSKFLEKNRPDVIHVHTLQGFHKELFEAAHNLKIRMVFTTHDYYPFCPKCVLLNKYSEVCCGSEGRLCVNCCAGCGLSKLQEAVMQSRLYMKIKYSKIVERLRRKQRQSNERRSADSLLLGENISNEADYQKLLEYYSNIMDLMNLVHANSNVAYFNYKRVFPNLMYKMIPITHKEIDLEKRTVSQKNPDLINLTFLGGKDRYKGLDILMEAVRILDRKGIHNWNLWLYGADFEDYIGDTRIHNGGYFSHEQESHVWDKDNQLLVVPSRCMETFGFVVLESLAHGVPVICSDLIGAKVLVPKENVFLHGNAEALANTIMSHSRTIDISEENTSMAIHSNKIINQIYSYS